METRKLSASLIEQIENHPESTLDVSAGEALIRSAAYSLPFPLPPSHVEFLGRWNGGELNGVRFCACGEIGPHAEFDLLEDGKSMGEYIAGVREGRVYPFACDWGGDWYCFDLERRGQDGEYPVVRWNHDAAEEPDEELWTLLAPNFVAFLQKVLEDDYDD